MRTQVKYGRLLVDYVNAKTDEAAIKALHKGMSRLKKIPEDVRTNNSSLELPENIKEVQAEIRSILDDIIQKNNLYDNKALDFYIRNYNLKFMPFIGVNKGSSLWKIPTFSEDKSVSWDILISYYLIRFLQIENYPIYLRKCSRCKEIYFIKKNRNKKTERCKECSKYSTYTQEQFHQWYIDNKPRLEAKRQKIKREKKIEKMMKRSNCTREEAEEYIRADEEIEADAKILTKK